MSPATVKQFTRFLPWLILALGLGWYGYGVAPGLAILDSGEFLGVASTLGIAHPTGYPLYGVVGFLFSLIPFGDKAHAINLLSAAAGAAAAAFLAAAAMEFATHWNAGPRAKLTAGIAAGLIALAGRTLWSVSTLAEVYALNAALWGALLWTALRLRARGDAPSLLLFSLASGLAFTNHMSLIFFLPAAAAIAWPGKEKMRALNPLLPLALATGALAASLNLYVPLRSYRNPPFDWNHPSTLRFWLGHATALQYRGNWLDKGFAGVASAWKTFTRDFFHGGTPAATLAAAAAAFIIKGPRVVVVALFAYGALYLSYCLCYDIPDIQYYFVPLYLTLAFLAAAGVAYLLRQTYARGVRFLPWLVVAAGIAAVGWAAGGNAPYAHRRGWAFAERYGARFLKALPYRSLVFPSGDTNTFLSWYNVFVRGRRPDVAVVDQIRLTGRGYLATVAARYPDLKLPAETDVDVIAAKAFLRGDFDPAGDYTFAASDDFILPEIIATIIADNQGRRPIFWGLGDEGRAFQGYLLPYDVVMEITPQRPDEAELKRRGGAAAAAFGEVCSFLAGPAGRELRDPYVARLFAVYAGSLGDLLISYGLHEEALTAFRAYAAAAPKDPVGYQNIGSVYVLMGRPAEAAVYMERAVALAPRDVELRRRYIHTLLGAGQTRKAWAAAGAWEKKDPAAAAYLKGVVCREQGNPKGARDFLAKAEKRFEKDAEYWWERGLTAQELGDYKAAEVAFTRAIGLNPRSPRFKAARGAARVRLKDYDGARRDLEEALAADDRDARSHYNLACLLALEGNVADAMPHLAKAMNLRPDRYVVLALTDADLEACRAHPDFAELVRPYLKGPNP